TLNQRFAEEFAKKDGQRSAEAESTCLALLRPSVRSNGNLAPYAPFHQRFH
ncbi:UNVERIFIED_CONTAM: hypothetical protein Sindi_1264200, partial [Sesamum indicum]